MYSTAPLTNPAVYSNPYTLVAALAATAVPTLQRFMSGKSAEQKTAEYDLSAATNEIEKALDINRLAFWGGFTSQAEALEIYELLWGRLVHIADLARPLTAAQAYRTIADRDYNGKFANVWRVLFRDEILAVPPDHMEHGYLVPEWRWDIDLSTFKYGGEGSALLPDFPTPTTIANSTPEAVGMGGSGGGRGVLKWVIAGLGAWWFLR